MKIIILIFIVAGSAFAHGGEDHGASTTAAAPAVSGGQLKVVSYPGTLEVLVKYPAPKLDEPTVGRLYFADYASNHPVDPAGIQLSFPGALGAKVTKQPAKISDGVYEFAAIFVRDTNHTALLRYTYSESEQLASLSPFYAGRSAERQLAASGVTVDEEGFHFPTWLFIPIAIALAVLALVLFRKRRQRLVVTKTPTMTTITETKA